jgi:hypothetical protein
VYACLSGVERGKAQQSLGSDRRLRRSVNINKLPAQMRPAKGQYHSAIVAIAL